ncbi:DUF2779 domain-containing protein [Mariniblastus sp.]|nr:DUF2779 domain-containing protein [Mariniblastus sp.]
MASETDLWRIEQGNEFETLVRQRFPDGVLIKGGVEEAAEQTQTVIDDGANCLFQATAISGGCLVKVDVLKRDGDTESWKLYEVKSSTRVKDENVLDVAFQTWVFERAGFTISDVFVITANSTSTRVGEPDAEQFSTIHDVTEEVRDHLEDLEELIEPALEVIRLAEPPATSQHPCGLKPTECPSSFYCYPDLPEDSVFTIPRLRFKKARKLYDEGIISLSDLHDLSLLNEKQRLYVELVKSGETHFDRDEVKSFIDHLNYPISFLDYETASSVIPLFDGYHSHSQVVFQFSLHVIAEPGADLQHHEFLATGEEDPAVSFAAILQEAMPENGSILVWNKSFEAARNREIGERIPTTADFFKTLNERIVDLMDIVSKGHYVDPRFKGSASIKLVLPVLVPNMSYDELAVNNGSLASLRWLQMRTEDDQQQVGEIRENLLAYCRQDTLAMVELLRAFQRLCF